MCISLIAPLVLGAAGAALSATQKPKKPPPVVAPAAPAAAAQTPGGIIRVGNTDPTTPAETDLNATDPFVEKRKQAVALGGLGRGGLII